MSSMDDDFKKDNEWLEALEAEPDTDSDDTKDNVDEDSKDDDTDDDKADESAAGDDKVDDGDSADDETASKDKDDGDDSAQSGDEDAGGQDTSTAEDQTKAAVKEALQEIESSKAELSGKLESYKSEVTKTLYPEGIDRTLRDSDGDPITGIDDLTKLINPKTQDYFTDEEAGSWLLSAQQKLNQDVQQVERFVEEVAETNIRLEQGAARVVEKYGDFLSKNTELKDRLLSSYNKTVIKDPNTGIAIKDPIDVVEFFDMALEPVLANQKSEAEAAAKATKEAEVAAKKNRQADRSDLKQHGKSDTIPPEDKEWAEAIKEYEEGA
jgi:hypothetical protein